MVRNRNNQFCLFRYALRFCLSVWPFPVYPARAKGKFRIISFLIMLNVFLGASFPYSPALAAEKTDLTDNIIGSTFKILAKTFISTADIERIKKDNIERITRMDETKFRHRYAKIYSIIEKCPSLRAYCGLEKEATKQQITGKIKSLDKKMAYEVIDLIPNSLIASQLRAYFNEKKEQVRASKITSQIQSAWDRMISKISPEQPKKAR